MNAKASATAVIGAIVWLILLKTSVSAPTLDGQLGWMTASAFWSFGCGMVVRRLND